MRRSLLIPNRANDGYTWRFSGVLSVSSRLSFFFLSLWGLRSPTRDRTPAFNSESLEFYRTTRNSIKLVFKDPCKCPLKKQISELSKLSMSYLGEARWGVMVTQKCMHHPVWFSPMHYFLFKQRTLSCSCSSESCFVFVPSSTHTHTHTHTHTQ